VFTMNGATALQGLSQANHIAKTYAEDCQS